MNILNVAPFIVYPTTTGGHVRVHNLNIRLSKKHTVIQFSHGVRRENLALRDILLNKVIKVQINKNYVEYRYANILTLIDNAICKFMKVLPINASLALEISSPKIKDFVSKLVDKSDIINVETPFSFEYLYKKYVDKIPICVTEHNIEYIVAKENVRRLPIAYRILVNKVKKMEYQALSLADAIITVSENDKRLLRKIFNIKNNIFVIPNGVDTSKFLPADSNEKQKYKKKINLPPDKYIILFIGSDYLPNIIAVENIIKIAKILKNRRKDLVFVIVGRVGEHFKHVKLNNVIFTGVVKDILPYYKAADIAICPLLSGSGTSLKMLEYLASGLPTITTKVGARGLDVINNKHAIICNIEDFPEMIEYLIDNPDIREKIRKYGRKLVERKYDWDIISKKKEKALMRIYNKF